MKFFSSLSSFKLVACWMLFCLLAFGGAVQAQTLSSLTLNSGSVTGGTSSTGTVTLSVNAPSGGKVVTLSSNQGAATVPASVTVASGVKTATFTVSTSPVAANVTATISAAMSGVTKTAALIVNAPVMSTLSLSTATVVGGTAVTGTVTLTGNTPTGGMAVTLSSNATAASVPTSVTVAAASNTATFSITTTPVAANVAATISAVRGVTLTATLTVQPPVPTTLTLSPTTLTGGTSSTGTVTLTGNAPSGGISVSLSSNNSAATVPASVSVAAGVKTATFAVTTVGVPATTIATISATLGGATKTAPLTINALAASALSLSPTSVYGGLTNSTGTLTLTGNAVGTSAVATLSSSSSAATVPATINVAVGSSTATFTVNTTAVATDTSATISATCGGVTKTASLLIKASIPSTLTLNPTTVRGGSPSTATVTLNTNTPAAGMTVNLSSNSVKASVPATVVVAGGTKAATFVVTTLPSITTATISATANGTAKTATLTTKGPPPPSFYVQGGNQKAVLAWDSVVGVDSYNVKRGSASAGPFTIVASVPDNGSNRGSCEDLNLTNETTYYYVISSVDDGVEGVNSSVQSVVPRASLKPAILAKAYGRFNQISLDTAGNNYSQSYSNFIVYRSLKTGGPYQQIGYIDQGLYADIDGVVGQTYYYVVTKGIGADNSPYSNEVSATFRDVVAPTLQGAPGNQSVNLTFSHSFYSGAVPPDTANAPSYKYYNVYRATQSGGPYTSLVGGSLGNGAPAVYSYGTTTYSDSGLLNGTTYYYKIRQSSHAGNGVYVYSPESAEISVTPNDSFSSPQNLTGTYREGKVYLNWSATVGATNYDVMRSTSMGGPYDFVNTTNATNYVDSQEWNYGQYYYYIVMARDVNDISGGPSNEVKVFPSQAVALGWQSGQGISCGGIQWPPPAPGLHTLNSEAHLSAFLATDWDQRDRTLRQLNGTLSIVSSTLSDPCSYSWSAVWASGPNVGQNAGSFKDGRSKGQSVIWIVPGVSGTVTLNLVVDDQSGANQGRDAMTLDPNDLEAGSRNDVQRGFNDEPLIFARTVQVGTAP